MTSTEEETDDPHGNRRSRPPPLHLRHAVHVVETQLVDSPAVVGWLKPVVLFPVAAVASLSPAQVEAILAHELAHVRRHDFLVNLLQTIAEDPSLIAHEMTHMFVFDILPLSRLMSGVPPWLPEGLAEHVAGVWTAEGEQGARDAAALGLLPSRLDQDPSNRQMLHFSHAIVDFVDHEFGQAGLRGFMFTLREGAPADGSSPYRAAFGVTPEEFDRGFHRFMREIFRR